MTNELNTLNKAGYELTADEFDNMQSKHSYIGEKLILDLVNGVGVIAKDLNDASKSKEKFLLSLIIFLVEKLDFIIH